MMSAPVSPSGLAPEALDSSETFFPAWSRYVDGFMANRSILRSALFPDKPEQMWFGYLYTRATIEPLTAWLGGRLAPEDLGRCLQSPLAPAHAVNVIGAMWNYLFASLGLVLQGREVDASAARATLDYWRRVHRAYVSRWEPPGPVPPLSGLQYRILDPVEAEALAEHLEAGAQSDLQPLIAALANYSWLMEAESRQGTFSHGLYPLADGTHLLVRTFGDLRGSTYPWLADYESSIPAGPLAMLVGLRDVTATFDALGVVNLTPEDYARNVTGVGVLTRAGAIAGVGPWLADLRRAVGRAHRHLYRIVMTWSREERFVAGARSYARLWLPYVEIGGGGAGEARRLVFDPLEAAVRDSLPTLVRAEGEAEIWTWAARTDRPTIFAPLLEAIGLMEAA